MSPNQPDGLRRFQRGARLVRSIMRPLATVTHQPGMLDTGGRAVVMVANHRSLFDVLVAVDALDRYEHRARCLVRRRYMDQPGLGVGLRLFDCIPAGDGTGEAIAEAVETLEGGRSIAIMVEGNIPRPEQRQADGMGEIRPGFLAIARKVDVPILPIGITGTDQVWPRGSIPRFRPWRRPTVDVRLGQPMEIGHLSDDDALAEARAAISGLLTDRST